jgi:hypothetical protein
MPTAKKLDAEGEGEKERRAAQPTGLAGLGDSGIVRIHRPIPTPSRTEYEIDGVPYVMFALTEQEWRDTPEGERPTVKTAWAKGVGVIWLIPNFPKLGENKGGGADRQ